MESQYPLLSRQDADRCGVGQGAVCCAYLTLGAKGWACAQKEPIAEALRARVAEGSIGARRLPTEDYPDCQLSQEA